MMEQIGIGKRVADARIFSYLKSPGSIIHQVAEQREEWKNKPNCQHHFDLKFHIDEQHDQVFIEMRIVITEHREAIAQVHVVSAHWKDRGK